MKTKDYSFKIKIGSLGALHELIDIFASEIKLLLRQKRDWTRLPLRGTSGQAVVVALQGNLGAGKTTFTRFLAQALKIRAKIQSPTFLIMKTYPFYLQRQKFNLVHIDCYRLKKAKQILDIGFREIINNHNNLVVIEWPERIKNVLPKSYLLFRIEILNQRARLVKIFLVK